MSENIVDKNIVNEIVSCMKLTGVAAEIQKIQTAHRLKLIDLWYFASFKELQNTLKQLKAMGKYLCLAEIAHMPEKMKRLLFSQIEELKEAKNIRPLSAYCIRAE